MGDENKIGELEGEKKVVRWGIRRLWGSKGWWKCKQYVVGRYDEMKINSEKGGERCLVKVGTYNVKCAGRWWGWDDVRDRYN